MLGSRGPANTTKYYCEVSLNVLATVSSKLLQRRVQSPDGHYLAAGGCSTHMMISYYLYNDVELVY